MFTIDARDALVFAHEHACRLREEAATDRLRRAAGTRRAFAASLRCVACRSDPAPVAHRPA